MESIPSTGGAAAPLESILITGELTVRHSRPPDYQTESRALAELAQAWADAPHTVWRRLVDAALAIGRAGSAGVSLSSRREIEAPFVGWPAVAGVWEPYSGRCLCRGADPCGLLLDRPAVELLAHPERYYADLAGLPVQAREALVAPFRVRGEPVGTLWLLAHDDQRQFDAEDARLLTSLAAFAAATVRGFEALAESAQFRTIFEQGANFAGVMMLDGTLIEANRLSLEACGLRREDVIGKKFWDCGWWNRAPEQQQLVREATRQAAGGIPFRRETYYFVADGTQRYLDLSLVPVRDDAGKVIFIVPTGNDITERRLIERVNSRFAAIVESSDDAIIGKDLNSIITSWNAGATRLFGYTADEAIGRPVTMLMPPDRVDEELGILERIRRGERVDHYETVRRRKDGTLLDISLTVSPVADESGRIVGASKIARNITDRKRAEQALLEADRQKNEFLATLAHELRNPLAPIRNSLNILRLTRGDLPAADRVQEMMERQVNHMVRLVDDLLEISRISTGKIELRLEAVEIASVIRSAIETSRPLIDAGGHRLATSIPPEPLTVDGDPVRLSQVVANLLNNSAKYTEPGGQIWLNVSRAEDEVVISVRDTGIGILPALLPHVLEMFTQAEREKRRSHDGLGIGLALVKRLVEMHGGTVVAHSAGEGRGSEFTIRLPLSERQLPRIGDRADAQHGQAARSRVLVVDDNEDAALSLAMLLKVLGNDVQTAHDGPAALRAFESFQPSVVLLDLGMPGMSGFEVAGHLRALPRFERVTLVALTGWGQEEDRRRTHEAGFDHHLVKPVNLDALQVLMSDVRSSA
ncbi:MAG TPA: PAS domain S-box protein [Pirellulales bacterium]|nr:PAS domain S-box protein [Pirellulales bacterium]